MPTPETDLPGYAVLWSFAGADRNGQVTVNSPIEIRVRWEDIKRETIDEQGSPVAIQSVVMVDREISPGSLLRKGELADLPTPVDSLKEVVDYEEVPDVKEINFQRTVTLRKFADSLPTVV